MTSRAGQGSPPPARSRSDLEPTSAHLLNFKNKYTVTCRIVTFLMDLHGSMKIFLVYYIDDVIRNP